MIIRWPKRTRLAKCGMCCKRFVSGIFNDGMPSYCGHSCAVKAQPKAVITKQGRLG